MLTFKDVDLIQLLLVDNRVLKGQFAITFEFSHQSELEVLILDSSHIQLVLEFKALSLHLRAVGLNIL